jgi:hypothetical protein
MFIVNIQDVRVDKIPNPQNPIEQISILNYLNRWYVVVQFFELNQLDSAQGLWRYLTNERGSMCIIIRDVDRYSVWTENIQKSEQEAPDLGLEPVLRVQLILIDGLWAEVRELLGQNQAASFGTEILFNLPSIESLKDLLTAITLAVQPDKSLQEYALSHKQLLVLYRELRQIGSKYLGKNYTKELLGDLHKQLPPDLTRKLQAWSQE